MVDPACERNPRICNRVCNNAARYNNRRPVRLRFVAPSRLWPAESLAEPFGNRPRTVPRAPHSWPGNTERRVSSVERPPFTQVCAGRNGNLTERTRAFVSYTEIGLHHHHVVATIRAHVRN